MSFYGPNHQLVRPAITTQVSIRIKTPNTLLLCDGFPIMWPQYPEAVLTTFHCRCPKRQAFSITSKGCPWVTHGTTLSCGQFTNMLGGRFLYASLMSSNQCFPKASPRWGSETGEPNSCWSLQISGGKKGLSSSNARMFQFQQGHDLSVFMILGKKLRRKYPSFRRKFPSFGRKKPKSIFWHDSPWKKMHVQTVPCSIFWLQTWVS